MPFLLVSVQRASYNVGWGYWHSRRCREPKPVLSQSKDSLSGVQEPDLDLSKGVSPLDKTSG